MNNLMFNWSNFLRTIIIFLVLTIVWTFLCIKYDEFTDIDKGLVSGLGYLILLAVSIGQNFNHIGKIVFFIFLTIMTFLIGSYVIGPLIGFTTNSMILYSIINSVFVSVTMAFFLDKLRGIEFKKSTTILTFLFLLLAYFIIDQIEDFLYIDYDMHPRLTMFIIFQFALIIPITIGITLKKAST